MTTLKNLADKQDLILLAEIGALIHDLGKLSKEFVTDPGGGKHSQILRRLADSCHPYFSASDDIRQYVLDWISSGVSRVPQPDQEVLNTLLAQAEARSAPDLFSFARWFVETTTGRLGENTQQFLEGPVLGPILDEDAMNSANPSLLPNELRELLNDVTFSSMFEHPVFAKLQQTIGDSIALHHRTYVRHRPELVQLLRAGDGGADGFDSWLDKQGQESELVGQAPGSTFLATAFGHEVHRLPVGPGDKDCLKEVRDKFAQVLVEELSKVRDGQATPAQVRPRIFQAAETAFRQALGETRRAANDVTLWDHSYSVASLYKAALTKVLLEGQWTEPKKIGWRFLRVGVDGLDFFAQAHHVTDMLGRQKALTEALDRVQDMLEVEYALGNEIYRDEKGSIFVMPGVDGATYDGLKAETETLVQRVFARAGEKEPGLAGELAPALQWNPEGPVRRPKDGMPDMMQAFGTLVKRSLGRASATPQVLASWWTETQAADKEICTVCGVRPIGYGVPNLYGPNKKRVDYYLEAANDRKICGPCLKRRGGRSKAWATNSDGSFERTIWTDEVADDNGRFALVVGRFGLEDWLDGKLVKTMLVAPGKEKNPSPARIRRCWDTTRRFWLDVEKGLPGEHLDQGEKRAIEQRPFRLRINPVEVKGSLGEYHVYDWPLQGGVTLSVIWAPDGQGGGHFLTADNLRYLAGPEQLDLPQEARESPTQLFYELGRLINGQREVALREPSGYGQPGEVKARIQLPEGNAVELVPESAYTPYIPILAEPATFMVLVPASEALAVAQAIKTKYDKEMARVRDRLPLHLGLVFAPRRTPLAAVLEAGQAMLKMPDAWQEWQIKATGRKAAFSQNGRTFEWQYPAKMGDEEKPDVWYPRLLVVDPTKEELTKKEGAFKYVDNLSGTVFIRPAHFDFDFLDTTARRFEIHYGKAGRRRRSTRPYLLDDLDRLRDIWEEVKQLEKSQRHQVIAAIEATREAWFGADREGKSLNDGVFRQFVGDTLAGAAWPQGHKWAALGDETRKEIIDAGVRGELADWAELHQEILKE